MSNNQPIPNLAYSRLASDQQIKHAAEALETNGIHVLVTANGEEAKAKVFEIIPDGAEVFTGQSRTLDTLGLFAEVDKRYRSVRAQLATMDRKTQMREMVKLGLSPNTSSGVSMR